MKFFVFLIALFVPTLAFAQGAAFSGVALVSVNTAVGLVAKPVGGALITVCPHQLLNVSIPCNNPIMLFTDVTLLTQSPNPFNADLNGNFVFYASPGVYDVSVTGVGVIGFKYALGSATVSSGAFNNGFGAGYQDVGAIASPGNPATGNDRLFVSSANGLLGCLTSTGTNCMPASGLSNPMTAVGDMIGGGASGVPARIPAGLTGQVPTALNGATPLFSSPGLPDGNGGVVVAAGTYLVQCDSTTAVIDRGKEIVFGAGAGVVTVPDSTATGCGNNLFFGLLNKSGSTLAVNRSGADVFDIYNGSNPPLVAQTTFSLFNGQFAILNNGRGTTWDVRVTTGGVAGGGVPYAVGGGTAQTQTVTLPTNPISYSDGMIFSWKPAAANTGAAPTINVNAIGAKTIVKANSSALVANDIITTIDAWGQYHLGIDKIVLMDPQAEQSVSADYAVGTPPACVPGTAGGTCHNEGTPAPGLSNVDEIYADSSQHAASVNNNNTGNMPVSRVTCVSVTPVTINTSTTSDQNLMACPLSSNIFNVVGRVAKIYAAGVYSTAAASTAQITAKVKLCSVSGCGSGTVIAACNIQTVALGTVTVTNNTWTLECVPITQTAGASAVFERSGRFSIDLGALTTAADSIFLDPNATAVTAAIDSTQPIFVQITGAFSAASGSNAMTERQLFVEFVN